MWGGTSIHLWLLESPPSPLRLPRIFFRKFSSSAIPQTDSQFPKFSSAPFFPLFPSSFTFPVSKVQPQFHTLFSHPPPPPLPHSLTHSLLTPSNAVQIGSTQIPACPTPPHPAVRVTSTVGSINGPAHHKPTR